MLLNTGRIVSLQCLRAVAALMVFAAHFSYSLTSYDRFYYDGYLFSIGVDIFFIISGFVMFMLMDGIGVGAKNALDFLVRRVARIAPVYWLATAIVLVLFYMTRVDMGTRLAEAGSVSRIIRGFLFLDPHPIVVVGWTLVYEIFFYFICAICILIFNSNLKRFVFASVIIFTFFFYRLYLILNEMENTTTTLSPILFIVGAVIFFAAKRGYITRLNGPLFAALTLGGFVFLYGTRWNHGSLQWTLLSTVTVILFLSLEIKIRALNESSFMSRFVTIFEKFGNISYSFYLFHLYIILFSFYVVFSCGITGYIGSISAFILSMPATILISTVSYYYFEVPVNRFIVRTYRRFIS